MPRDGKDKTPSKTTATIRCSIALTDTLFQKLCNEKVFPKRSRWLFSGKIADCANDYMSCIYKANEVRVVTQKERNLRHFYLTQAYAELMNLDAKICQAVRVLSIDPDTMEYYANAIIDCRNALLAWINYDNKRFGLPTKLSIPREVVDNVAPGG